MDKKLIVVKVGSSSLTGARGTLDGDKIDALTGQLCALHASGHKVILVSSGAVAAGFSRLGYAKKPTLVPDKQACAAVGQGLLMQEYNERFEKAGIACGQLLLTQDDFTDRRRYKNAFNALTVLISRGAIPVINENDSVAVEEFKIGENDTLSAQVAAMLHANLLVLLTDVDGLYTANPATDPNAARIARVAEITDEITALAGGSGSAVGTGGMKTKLKAAALATSAGVNVRVCSYKKPGSLLRAAEDADEGTLFVSHGGSLRTRQQWLAFYAMSSGNLYVDEGAADALTKRGKSLLARGIVAAEGDFKEGDVVSVFRRGSHEYLGRGIVGYDREGLLKAMRGGETDIDAIHRDNWVKAI